jgi:hypothetical protein
MLTDEMGTATNIKSRVNRQSVLGAITSTQQVRFATGATSCLVLWGWPGPTIECSLVVYTRSA